MSVLFVSINVDYKGDITSTTYEWIDIVIFTSYTRIAGKYVLHYVIFVYVFIEFVLGNFC